MDIRVLIDDFYEFHGKYIKSSPNLKLFAIKTYIFAKKQHSHDKKYGIGSIPSAHLCPLSHAVCPDGLPGGMPITAFSFKIK